MSSSHMTNSKCVTGRKTQVVTTTTASEARSSVAWRRRMVVTRCMGLPPRRARVDADYRMPRGAERRASDDQAQELPVERVHPGEDGTDDVACRPREEQEEQ